MRPIQPSEVKPNADYERVRDQVRQRILPIKAARRVQLGDEITLLFENHDTMLYQVQEMARVEQITDPRALKHEVETYNELVPGDGELSATLLLEYPEPEVRARRLAELVGIEKHVSMEIEGEGSFPAVFDMRQIDDRKVSSVHYVKFRIGDAGGRAICGGAGVEVVVDHPRLQARTRLTDTQLAALRQDLTS
ncbi:MAG TPA: DUF3501 family protein [Candidatus Limnocylindrales bacterium]|nr:DUF3501 family protein [Candidatus Limnocylindrales bacterium]